MPPRLDLVVVAAGRSTRMGDTDKTFTPILGEPLIVHTLRRLAAADVVGRIALVVAEESLVRAEGIVREFALEKIAAVCVGGARRQDSVYAGLIALGETRWVGVHDGARPCVSADMLVRGLDAVQLCGRCCGGGTSKRHHQGGWGRWRDHGNAGSGRSLGGANSPGV